MELKEFRDHIRGLASLPRTPAPVISCYLRVEGGRLKHRSEFTGRVEELSVREAMLHPAEQRGFRLEFVRDSPTLTRLGGVGCLLRFRPGPQFKTRADLAHSIDSRLDW